MLDKIEEISLITRCVAFDDRRAFARLVDAYSPGLHGFLYNLTQGDASLTDDLAQEAFLKAYTQLRQFQGLSRFGTWLYRIAVNEFVTYKRKRREERITDGSLALPDESRAYYDSFDAAHDVSKAMRMLSDIERTLVLLFYYEDKSLKDISKITDLPQGTVKSYLHRAKKKMGEFLKNDESCNI